MAMRRKTSLIWNHFSQNDIKEAKCNYCSSNKMISAGNTGNLTRHLKRKHPTISVSPIIREPVAMTSETSELPNPTVETSQDNQGILVSSPLPSSSSGQNLMTDYIRNTKPLPHQKLKN
ncbi:hypothetical protein EVAR_88804_1 [Eumeta japonica]|uniref:BED-type domain-containing protein n=1 Tax=Eumeta variegata TaxID=151549 RepID=A0A4C1YGJ5_EUMVA|nr:hypothetical protein EVAR_88804_1 [Eumeta japonica]